MNIGQAIDEIKAGKRVSRSSWVTHKIWLEMGKATPEDGLDASVDTPHVLMSVVRTKTKSWLPGWDELIADDYVVVDDAGKEDS